MGEKGVHAVVACHRRRRQLGLAEGAAGCRFAISVH
jgi:hypothetical protein